MISRVRCDSSSPSINRCATAILLGIVSAAAQISHATEYDYDELGRLLRVTHPGGGTAGSDLVITYEYDAAGNRTRPEVSNVGASNSPPVATVLISSVLDDPGDLILLKNIFNASDPNGDTLVYEFDTIGSVGPNAYFSVSGVNRGTGPLTLTHAEYLIARWRLTSAFSSLDTVSMRASDGSLWSASVSSEFETTEEPCPDGEDC